MKLLDETLPASPPPNGGAQLVTPRALTRVRSDEFLLGLLAQIERMSGTWSLSFFTGEDRRIGDVLVLDQKIGLVTLAEEDVPLSQRLRRRDADTAASVRDAVTRAKAEGRPLADVLAGLGVEQSGFIRVALLDQVVDGLAAIARAASMGLSESCIPAMAKSGRLLLSAFRPAEVYWRAVAMVASAHDDAAGRCFHRMSSLAETAVLIARASDPSGRDAPIAGLGLDSISMHEIVSLGRCGAQAAQAPALAAAGVEPELTLLSAGDRALLAVATPAQVALLGGLGPEARARVLSEMCRPAGAARA